MSAQTAQLDQLAALQATGRDLDAEREEAVSVARGILVGLAVVVPFWAAVILVLVLALG